MNADDRYYMMADEIGDLKREVKELEGKLSKLENRIAAEGFSDLETMISKYKTVMLAANELSIEADEEIESLKARLAEAERRESEWIKVTDMLPEKKQDVLIWFDRFGGDIGIGWWSKDCEAWFMNGGMMLCYNVTHWMPLPQPPKGE